jgi:hypothetical protein
LREEQTIPMSLHGGAIGAACRAPDRDLGPWRRAGAGGGAVLGRSDACQRACVPGHITASALVLDHTGTETLLTLHPRLGRWVQLGGHCEDGDADIAAAALREAGEESGIDGLTIGAMPAAPSRTR